MGPLLSSLVKLQSVENQLRVVKTKLARSRRTVVLQENQIRTLQNKLESKKEDIQLVTVQSDRLELELKSREEHIAKYRTALNHAKTNKEYAILLTDLNTSKADNSKLEEQILEFMKTVETDREECTQLEEEIQQQKQILEQVRQRTETQAIELQKQIEDIQKQWDKAAHDVPEDVLEIFKRVADTYDGEAIVTVEHQDNYSCGGCFMIVTNESVNLLMTKDELVRCPNCTRILVLKETE